MSYLPVSQNPEIINTLAGIIDGTNTRKKLAGRISKSPQALDKQIRALKGLVTEKKGRGRSKLTTYTINWSQFTEDLINNHLKNVKDKIKDKQKISLEEYIQFVAPLLIKKGQGKFSLFDIMEYILCTFTLINNKDDEFLLVMGSICRHELILRSANKIKIIK